MTLEELRCWQTSGKKKEIKHSDIVKMVISKERAEENLGEGIIDDFYSKYNLHTNSDKVHRITAFQLYSVALKIVKDFPYNYSSICNDTDEVGKEFLKEYKTEKNKKSTLWGFNIWCFALHSICETFGGLGGAVGAILWWLMWWLARKEYFKKITKNSSKADKFVIYLKWSLILVVISLGIGLPLKMWLSTIL